ncbi:MAG: TIGR02530 family flagellar biosynthesis protein [Bdellovibrionales bacterium]
MTDISKALNNSVSPLGGVTNTNGAARPDKAGGPSFKDALGNINPMQSSAAEALASLTGLAQKSANPVKFSNHAIDRMQARGIRYSPEQMMKIEQAIDKAAAKGGKDTLLLTDNSALIVSVNNRTVVTVMDKENLKENVFTKIDSTVVL